MKPENSILPFPRVEGSGGIGAPNRAADGGFSGGQGGGGGDMERIARLEADVSHISRTLDIMRTDIRDLRNWGLTFIFGLGLSMAGAIATVYFSLDGKIAGVAADVDEIQLILQRHDFQFQQINQSLQGIQQSIERLAQEPQE